MAGPGGGGPSSGDRGPPQAGGAGTYETVYTNPKAGMEGVDPEHLKRVVLEASVGSEYFKREQEKAEAAQRRADQLLKQAQKLGRQELEGLTKAADAYVAELEAHRDLEHHWLHVDMDAFYAAVECLKRPELKEVPFAVGGIGMISTANYHARTYGVRSAMPGFIGLKLCPQLKFVKSDWDAYRREASKVRAVLSRFDENFISGGLDEVSDESSPRFADGGRDLFAKVGGDAEGLTRAGQAYLNVSHLVKAGQSPEEVAAEVRRAVFEATTLTCSCGLAPNRMLAKVCSDLNKPNGQFVLQNSRDAVLRFVQDLSLRKIGGVGKVTERMLATAVGAKTCSELFAQRGLLMGLFSKVTSSFLIRVSLGIGGSGSSGGSSRKGISCERTFKAVAGFQNLSAKLDDIAKSLSAHMVKEELRGKHLTLKIKLANFEVKSRSVSLPTFTDGASVMLDRAKQLLQAEVSPTTKVRLLGIRMATFEGFGAGKGQLTIEQALLKGNTGADAEVCAAEEMDLESEPLLSQRELYECPLCGAAVLRAKQSEHEDFHAAQALQKQLDEEEREMLVQQELERKRRRGAKAGGSKPAARRKKDKNGVLPGTHRSIESFFSGPR